MNLDLSIIIVSWNVKSLLNQCLSSIFNNPPKVSFEVLVVDNNSHDGSAVMVKGKYPQVKLILNQTNLGFAKANNQAIQESQSRYILLLNPDTQVLPGTLDKMINFMETRPETGALGCKLLNPDGTTQPSCRRFPTINLVLWENLFLSRWFPDVRIERDYKMTGWKHDDLREIDQPMGACLMIRSRILKEIGPMDEQFFMFFEEVDLCYRIKKAGWKIYFTPEAKVIHYSKQSIEQMPGGMSLEYFKSQYKFMKKHFLNKTPFRFFLLTLLYNWNKAFGGYK